MPVENGANVGNSQTQVDESGVNKAADGGVGEEGGEPASSHPNDEVPTATDMNNASTPILNGKFPPASAGENESPFAKDSSNTKKTDGSASFLRAARAGNLDKVLEFLKTNTDINTCNANGLNALHLASKEGHTNVVSALIERNANVDSATKKGNTALHIASLAGQDEIVKVLVESGATVNIQSQNGFTPLYMAAQENHDSVVRFLLAHGANQSLATEDGFTPLAVALQQGHDRVVSVLLENDTRGKVRLPALHIAAKKDDAKAAALLLHTDHNPDITSKSGFTPLHIASHYGNDNIAALLIQRGADVNYVAKHQITPLHVASKWGKGNMVSLLLDKGANIEAKTRDGLTPLHCAARSGHETVVDMLLEKGAPITAKTKNGLAPLHMASQGDHVDAARILLYHKAPVDDVTVDFLTALHVAAHCGHVRVAKLLLDRKADPNARALNGFTPLHIACKKNRIKVVELLLKHGASIEATTESGLTPLHVASFMGCMNIVIYLIQHGASADVPTVRGESPLHLAARANQTDIIRILLRNGAEVDAKAREQQTALHIASRLGNTDIVGLLLQQGASVDAPTKDLYTPLHIAAKEGQEEVAGVLLDHGASLNTPTKKGFTPLHLAAKYGHMKVARLLLQREAPADPKGKNGVTPLHVAAHYDHQNVAMLLLDKGAQPHATAKNGYTPLHIAARKNQMDIAGTLLEYGANANAESKAGFTPLHLSAQEGHKDMGTLLLEHGAQAGGAAKNGLTPLHLCAQEDRVPVAAVLVKHGASVDAQTKAGYTPLHVASHFGQMNMVRFLLQHGTEVDASTQLGYTPLHQAAQQGHTQIVNLLLENKAQPNMETNDGKTALSIAQRLGYISVVETLKVVTETRVTTNTTTTTEEKYKVVVPETMHETFMSESEDEGADDTMLGDQSYRYLTVDEMKSLGDDSLPIDVTRDEKMDVSFQSNVLMSAPGEQHITPQHKKELLYSQNFPIDNVDVGKAPILAGPESLNTTMNTSYNPVEDESLIVNDESRTGVPDREMTQNSQFPATVTQKPEVSNIWDQFLVSFMVDARGGAMRGCRHSGVRVIIPPRKAAMPMRITCRYLKKDKLVHAPPLMEGEALASRILEMGPSGAKFLGPVIIEVPHFASLRGKEREIVILRSDNGETWREHTLEATEEAVQEVLNESFDGEELKQLEDLNTNRITRILTTDFPQYFAIVTRIRQEVHAIGPEGGMVSSTVVPQVQAVFPQGALTKKIKVGLQAQPISTDLVAKLLGNRVAVSPIVTVEPRRRKFHKPITLTIPVPQAASKGMINQYSGEAPTLRLLCSITGGTTRAQWEDVTGSTPLTFVNDCVSFTTTVSARFWLMDCTNIPEATKMATELYREAIHVPFMAKFVVFGKRHQMEEARVRVFCMTDDKEDKTLESQEHFIEVAKSRDVEVLEGKSQYLEFAGNLIPVTKSGDQLAFNFYAFRENRLPFTVRVKDQNSDPVGRVAFMRQPKVGRGDAPQNPICNLNLTLPDNIQPEPAPSEPDLLALEKKYAFLSISKADTIHKADLRLSDISNMLTGDWVALAKELEISDSDINIIKSQYPDNIPQQAIVMLRLWMQTAGNKATGNTLEKALRSIHRDDIVDECICNVEVVTDDSEKATAEEVIDRFEIAGVKGDVVPEKTEPSPPGEICYEEKDMMKEAESADEEEISHKIRPVPCGQEDEVSEMIIVPQPRSSTTQPTSQVVVVESFGDDKPQDLVESVQAEKASVSQSMVDENSGLIEAFEGSSAKEEVGQPAFEQEEDMSDDEDFVIVDSETLPSEISEVEKDESVREGHVLVTRTMEDTVYEDKPDIDGKIGPDSSLIERGTEDIREDDYSASKEGFIEIETNTTSDLIEDHKLTTESLSDNELKIENEPLIEEIIEASDVTTTEDKSLENDYEEVDKSDFESDIIPEHIGQDGQSLPQEDKVPEKYTETLRDDEHDSAIVESVMTTDSSKELLSSEALESVKHPESADTIFEGEISDDQALEVEKEVGIRPTLESQLTHEDITSESDSQTFTVQEISATESERGLEVKDADGKFSLEDIKEPEIEEDYTIESDELLKQEQTMKIMSSEDSAHELEKEIAQEKGLIQDDDIEPHITSEHLLGKQIEPEVAIEPSEQFIEYSYGSDPEAEKFQRELLIEGKNLDLEDSESFSFYNQGFQEYSDAEKEASVGLNEYVAKAPDFESEALDFETKYPNLESKALDFETKSPDFESETRAHDFESEIPDLDKKFSDLETKSPDFETRVSDMETKAPATDFDTKASDLEIETTNFETKSPDFESETIDFEMKESGIELKAPDFETKLPDFQSKTTDIETKTPDFATKSVTFESETTDIETKTPDFATKSVTFESETTDLETKTPDFATKSVTFESETTDIETIKPDFATKSVTFESESTDIETIKPDFATKSVTFESESTDIETIKPDFATKSVTFESESTNFETDLETKPLVEEGNDKEQYDSLALEPSEEMYATEAHKGVDIEVEAFDSEKSEASVLPESLEDNKLVSEAREDLDEAVTQDGFTQPSGEPSQMVHGDTPPPTDVKPSVTATELDASQTKPTEKVTAGSSENSAVEEISRTEDILTSSFDNYPTIEDSKLLISKPPTINGDGEEISPSGSSPSSQADSDKALSSSSANRPTTLEINSSSNETSSNEFKTNDDDDDSCDKAGENETESEERRVESSENASAPSCQAFEGSEDVLLRPDRPSRPTPSRSAAVLKVKVERRPVSSHSVKERSSSYSSVKETVQSGSQFSCGTGNPPSKSCKTTIEDEVSDLMAEVKEATSQIKREVRQLRESETPTPDTPTPLREFREFLCKEEEQELGRLPTITETGKETEEEGTSNAIPGEMECNQSLTFKTISTGSTLMGDGQSRLSNDHSPVKPFPNASLRGFANTCRLNGSQVEEPLVDKVDSLSLSPKFKWYSLINKAKRSKPPDHNGLVNSSYETGNTDCNNTDISSSLISTNDLLESSGNVCVYCTKDYMLNEVYNDLGNIISIVESGVRFSKAINIDKVIDNLDVLKSKIGTIFKSSSVRVNDDSIKLVSQSDKVDTFLLNNDCKNYLSDIRPKYYFNECEIKNEFATMPSIKDENSDSQPLLSVPYLGSEANGQEHLTDIEELASEGDASPSVSPSPMKPHLVKKGSDDEKSTDDESVEGSGDELETEPTVPVIDIETFLPGNSQEVLSFTEGYAREPSPMLSDFEGDKVNIDKRHSRNVKRAVNKALSLGSEEVSQDLTDEENMTDSAPNDTDDNNSEILDSSLPDYYLHGGDSISNHEIVKSVSPVSKLEFGTKKSRHGKPKECLLVQEEPEGNTDVEDLSTESQKIVKTLKTKRKKPKSKTKRNKNIPSVGSTLVPTPNEEEGVTDTEMLDGSNASSTSSEDSEDFNEDVVIPAEDLGELTDTENMHTSDMEDEDLIPCPVEKSDVPPMPEPLNENIKISETGDKDDEDPQGGMNEGEGRNSGKRRRAHNEEAKEPQSDSGEGEDADTDLDDVNIEDKDDEDIINDMIQRIPKEDTNILLEMDGGSDFVSNSKSENPQAEEEPRESTLTLGNTPEAVTDVEEWDDKGGVTKVKRKSPKCKAKYASDTDTDNTEESDLDDSKPSYRKKPQKGAKGTRRLPLVQQVSDVKLVATDRGLLSIVITPDDTSTNAVEDVPSEEKELVILEEDEWDKSITETVEAPQSAVLATDDDQEPVTDTEDFEDTEFLGINRPDTPLPPDTSTLPSPKREKIHIVEDEYGVPHVKIENLDDDEADIAEEAEQTLTDDENVEFDEDEASNLIVNIDSDGEASSILMGLDSIEVSTKTKNKKNRRAALNPIDPEDGHTDIEEISPLRKAKRRPKTKRTTLGVNDDEGEGEEGHTDIENLDDPQEDNTPVVAVEGEESSGTDYEHFETSGGEESEAPPPCAPTPEVIRKSAVKRTVVYRENPGGTFRTEIQEENPTGRFLALGVEPSGGATDVEDVEISEGEEASEDSFRKSGASPNLPDIDDSKVSVSVKPVHHHSEEAEEESQIKENLLLPEPHGTHTDVESLDEGEETEVLTTAVSRSTTSTEAPPESTLKEADLAVLDSIVATQEAEVEEMVFTESESTKRKSSAVEEEAGSSSSSKTEAGKRVPPPIPPRKILPEPPGRGAPESLLLEKVKKASGELEPQQSSSDEGDEQLALMKDSPRWEEEEIQNEEPSDERPIKAEIKLLVKTTEVGKESIEIRSIREFVDKNAAEKEAKSDPPQPPEPTTITTTTTTQSTTTTTTTDDKKPSTRQKTSTKGKGRGKSNPRFVRPSEGGGASNEQGNNDDFNLMAQVRDLISVDDKEKELGSHSADFEESSKSEMKQKEKKTKPTT